ncbi:hypothetical protein MO973_21375 [Paenibacillus sp. TRM 82003]|nr:hypothetical protein [Paenibacillus sp. TRM 82003]
MPFQPSAGDVVTIQGTAYRIGEHPAFQDVPYGQEGRQGTVYRLLPAEGDRQPRALKVFKPKFRNPTMVYLAEQTEAFAKLNGLSVCSRYVITPEEDAELLKSHPDLLYSVMMPWIEGPTWLDTMLYKVELTREQSLRLAVRFAKLLSSIEQRGLAHCDLSAPNVLLPYLLHGDEPGTSWDVELVDVEQMFGRGLDRPEYVPGGSPGYAAFHTANIGLWSKYADRFAGAVILAEMLVWFDPQAREAAWGESFFAPEEMQQLCERQALMEHTIRLHWGEEPAMLFAQAWNSAELNQCPTFGEWLTKLIHLDASAPSVTLPQTAPDPISTVSPLGTQDSKAATDSEVTATIRERLAEMIKQGKKLEAEGNVGGAVDIYYAALAEAPKHSEWETELRLTIEAMEANARFDAAPSAASASAAATSAREERFLERIDESAVSAIPEERKVVAKSRLRYAWIGVAAAVLLAGAGVAALSGRDGIGKEAAMALPTEAAEAIQAPVEGLEDQTMTAQAPSVDTSEPVHGAESGTDVSVDAEEPLVEGVDGEASAEPSDTVGIEAAEDESEEESAEPAEQPVPALEVPTKAASVNEQPAAVKKPASSAATTGSNTKSTEAAKPAPTKTESAPAQAPAPQMTPADVPTASAGRTESAQQKSAPKETAAAVEQKPESSGIEVILTSDHEDIGAFTRGQCTVSVRSQTIECTVKAGDAATWSVSLKDTFVSFRSIVQVEAEDDKGSVVVNGFLGATRPKPLTIAGSGSSHLAISSSGFDSIQFTATNKGTASAKVTFQYAKIVKEE